MRTSNNASESLRQSEVGSVWEEQLSGAAGTLVLECFQTFRVRAASAVTVTIDGTLAATMVSGEILVFNSGSGPVISVGGNVDGSVAGVSKRASSASIVITGTAFVQVARFNVRNLNGF